MDKFESLGLRAGVWEGVLRAEAAPGRVIMTHLAEVVGMAQLSPQRDGEWQVQVRLPADRLSDGTRTFILHADEGEGDEPLHPGAERLGSLALIVGEPLDEDLRAEIGLLRSEITLLKQEFRRLAAGLPRD